MNSPTHPSLPKGWIVAALDDCAEAQLGKMLDKLKRIKGWRLQYLRNANVRWGHFDLSDLLEMPFEEHELERYALRQGDVLVCEGGEPGRAAIWTLENSDIKFQKALHRVRMHGGINPNWLVQRLYFDSIRGTLGSAFTGTTINHLPLVALKQYRLPIPPLTEQKRILAVVDATLSKLDAAVAALERVRANLKRYWASVLKAAVEGRLVPIEADLALKEGRDFEPASMLLERILAERRRRWEESEVARLKAAGKPPKDDRWKSKYKEPVAPDTSTLPQLPDGWCWATVGQLGSIESGQTPDGIAERAASSGDVPWYRVADMNSVGNEVTMSVSGQWLSWHSAAKLGLHIRPSGTIIFPKRGGAIATNKKRRLGQPSAYDLNTMGVIPRGQIGDYLWAWFNQLDLAALSDGSNVPQINHGDIQPLPVSLPPMAEQRRIVFAAENLNSVAEKSQRIVEDNLLRCTRLRQSILKWAFEGRLVDQDPNDEPASVLLERIRAERAAMPSRKSRKSSDHQTEAAK